MWTVLDIESCSTHMWTVLDAYEDYARHLCGLLDASPEQCCLQFLYSPLCVVTSVS
ncbi:hypothetical protein A2U01_0105763 [Trifolium medium]|uniref:Uncharacterized protein n=1 Tax=Trifolium medium TaxID=97028 RepID=A0A392VC79_9FABA|nr:hypothetical protein [Trifolium medium]